MGRYFDDGFTMCCFSSSCLLVDRTFNCVFKLRFIGGNYGYCWIHIFSDGNDYICYYDIYVILVFIQGVIKS